MMTLKLDGKEIKVIDSFMNYGEGEVMLEFIVEQDLVPTHLLPYCDRMQFRGKFEVVVDEDTHLEFEGTGVIFKQGDLLSLMIRYM